MSTEVIKAGLSQLNYNHLHQLTFGQKELYDRTYSLY